MKVSVITTTKNSSKYLESCILSVLNQEYPNIEHVFIDGLSDDGTLDILRKYESKYPNRIRYISEPDKGACDAWNKGIKLSSGDILGWLGSDDAYLPDTIATVVNLFQSNPEKGIVFGHTNIVDESGKRLNTTYAEEFNLKRAVNTACCMYTSSTFVKKAVFDKVGELDDSINVCDLDFYLRAGKQIKFLKVDKVLSQFRMHSGSVTGAKDALYMYAMENYMVAKRYGATWYSPRGRNYIIMSLTRPFHRIITRLYYSKLFNKILSYFYHIIAGNQGRQSSL